MSIKGSCIEDVAVWRCNLGYKGIQRSACFSVIHFLSGVKTSILFKTHGKFFVRPAMVTTLPSVSKVITEEYGEYYQNEGDKITDQVATQSSLDLGQIKVVAESVNELAEILIKDLNNVIPGVITAREKAQKFTYPEYIDLLSFLQQLIKWLPNNDDVKIAVKNISSKINDPNSGFVIANAKWGDNVKDANGVSIYFPTKENYSPDYSDLLFSKEGKWNEFLTKLFSV